MKKNLFLTFCFACCPGAGQMYLGYTKRGVSLMLAFCAVFGVSSFLQLWLFAVILPPLWFFAFFDTFTIRNAAPEVLALKPDEYLYELPELEILSKKHHKVVGWVLIFAGLYALYTNLFMPLMANLLDALPYDLWWLWNLCYDLPTLFAAFLIVLTGLRLVRGEKVLEPDDVVEYVGGEDHD